jgi:ribosomal protein S18 acetylase RimI-like enzyme
VRIAVRFADARDIPAVLALWGKAANATSATDDADGLRSLLARDPEALLVAEHEGVLVGSVIVGFDGWRGSFYRLAVLPEHRRGGLARTLVEAGEARLRRLGVRRMDAVVSAEHDAALRFWGTAGFVAETGQVRLVRNLTGDGT